MAYRWRGKYFEVDPENPRAEGICARCGFRWNLANLQWQYSYQGTVQPQNTRQLVCSKCLDPLNPQDMPYILPPDPLPVFNARVEPYQLDESGPTQDLASTIVTDESSIPAAFYLDLYDGPPSEGGVSVLSTLTGSATRTNYASVMTDASGNFVSNASAISITASADESANCVWVVIFDAATSGNLLMSAPLLPAQTITMWNGAQFATGALTVALGTSPSGFVPSYYWLGYP